MRQSQAGLITSTARHHVGRANGCHSGLVAKSFPADFYVTCATVIPVLFLAVAVQGGTYEAMLQTALRAARTLPRRNRDYAAAEVLPVVAYLTFVAAVGGEVIALVVLYRGSEAQATRLIVLITTLVLLAVATAAPGWKWWQAQRAINRQRVRPVRATGEDPAFGYGAGKRPLWTVRDKTAEEIRIALRDAGCWEFSERAGGFVVEGGQSGTPFLVACATDDASVATSEMTAYIEALTSAGFRVEPDPDLAQVLQVRSSRS